MRAQDVMTTKVVSVAPGTAVVEIAKLLIELEISAVPVVGEGRRLLGIVSEADLIHEVGQDGAPRAWWLELLASPQTRATTYLKTHGRLAQDVMTRAVITVAPDTPLPEIARLLEARRIKRVPVVKDGELLGIVSRADLLHAFALQGSDTAAAGASDADLREQLMAELERAGLHWHPFVNIVVSDGAVHLWGIVHAEEEAEAFRLAAERVPGVATVESHLTVRRSMRSL